MAVIPSCAPSAAPAAAQWTASNSNATTATTTATASNPQTAGTCTGYRCLDRGVCFQFESLDCAIVARFVHDSVKCEEDDDAIMYNYHTVSYINRRGQLERISIDEAQELMQCVYSRKLLFQSSAMARNYAFWGYTAASSAGFDIFQANASSTATSNGPSSSYVSTNVAIGHVASLEEIERTALGLFATTSIEKGEWIGEYTGVVLVEVNMGDAASHDAYGICYPSLYEGGQLYLSAREYGNEMRCVNHSFEPNARFTPMIHDGILHVYCFAIRPIYKDEQIFVDYGSTYWRSAGVVPIASFTQETKV